MAQQQETTAKQNGSQKPESAMKHIVSFIIMIALTAAAFLLVAGDIVPQHLILPLILVFAAVQVFLQLFTFMHLDQKGTAFYTIFMVLGIVIAVVSAVGIILM